MLQTLTKKQVDKMHDDMIQWVTETLESDKSSYLYNILLEVKHLIEHMVRAKITWEEQNKLFMNGFNFANQQKENEKRIKKLQRENKKLNEK